MDVQYYINSENLGKINKLIFSYKKMIDKFSNIKEMISYSKGGILSKELIRNENSNVTLFCMAKGTEISEHTAKKRGFVYVIEGRGIFNLEGEKIVMERGVFIKLEKEAVHSLKAEEDTSFLLVLS